MPEAHPAAPDITVVIPVYNKIADLQACLDSVLGQAGVRIEIVLVDDCSSDGSWELAATLAKTRPELRNVRNATHRGAAYSRNVGISMARGRYLQFTDADDLLPEGALAALLDAAARTGADIVRGGLQTLREGVVAPWPDNPPGGERVGRLLDFPELWIPWFHICFLISRELVLQEGIQYPELTIGEDPVFLAHVLTVAHRICVCPRITYTYRQGNPRPKPTLRSVLDYVAHARLVRLIYGDEFAVCWERYRDFIAGGIRDLLSAATLSPPDREMLEGQIRTLESGSPT